jgi:hypothetical protein
MLPSQRAPPAACSPNFGSGPFEVLPEPRLAVTVVVRVTDCPGVPGLSELVDVIYVPAVFSKHSGQISDVGRGFRSS